MKRSLRIFVASVLVVVLALGCFAGCKTQTFTEKYGITISDKTVTYDGNSYGIEIDVDKEVLKDREYTVEYKYTKDGQAIEGTSFKDAGVYELVASVLVAGEDTPTELKAKLTINKANVEVELGNFFLRQGQGLSSIGTASLSDSIKLQGTDTVKDLGKVSYEVYNGSEKVQDLSALKPTAKESEALTVVMKFENDPNNYNFTFKNGKLYVLSSADYSLASTLKKEIANVPTSETINTFTYDQLQSFVDTADHIVTYYPGTSAIQRLMTGTVNVDSISGLLKTAKDRLSTTYTVDFDLDTSVGKGYVIGIEHTANNGRNKDDDEFLSELMGTKKSSLSDVEYKDTICFVIVINKSSQYKLNNVTVRGKNFTPSATYTKAKYNSTDCSYYDVIKARTNLDTLADDQVIYLFGTPRKQADVLNNDATVKDNLDQGDPTNTGSQVNNYKRWYGSKNYGAVAGAVVNSSLLGTLDGSTSITITPNYVNLYKVSVGGETNAVVESTSESAGVINSTNIGTIIPNVKKVTISAKGINYFNAGKSSVSAKIVHGMIPNGSVTKIAIQPKSGYVIKEVEIGETTVSGDKFTYNSYEYSYEFTVTEDMVNSRGELNIYVKLVDSYSLKVRINGLEVKNASKNGTYNDRNNTGSIKLTGDAIVSTDIPTVLSEKSLTIEVNPAANYVLTSLTLKGKEEDTSTSTSTTKDKDYNLLTDPQFSYSNGKITLDLSSETTLLSTNEVVVEAKFAEVYPVKVTSSRNGVGAETATKTGNTFTTKYGKVTVYNFEDDETDNLYNGQRYYIQIESTTGYVPSKITIAGTTYNLATDTTNEYKRYQVINGSDMFVLSSNDAMSAVAIENSTAELFAGTPTRYMLFCSPAKLAAGENFTIDVEYDAYYFIDLGVSYAGSQLEATLNIKGVVKSTDTGIDTTNLGDVIGGVQFAYNDASAIYRADNTLYAYFNDTSKNKVALTIAPKKTTVGSTTGTYTLEDPTWQYGQSVKETKSKMTGEKTYTEALDDTMLGGTTPEKATIKPGGSISITFDCNPVAPKNS